MGHGCVVGSRLPPWSIVKYVDLQCISIVLCFPVDFERFCIGGEQADSRRSDCTDMVAEMQKQKTIVASGVSAKFAKLGGKRDMLELRERGAMGLPMTSLGGRSDRASLQLRLGERQVHGSICLVNYHISVIVLAIEILWGRASSRLL